LQKCIISFGIDRNYYFAQLFLVFYGKIDQGVDVEKLILTTR